jgi:putrescine transport system permease protein
MSGRRPIFARLMLAFGLVFLYAPILSLIAYSFNASRLVTVWAGFSVRWYGELFHNAAIGTAAGTSLYVACTAATLSLGIGTLTGYGLARYPRFPLRQLFVFEATAPLVMPEIITGLSLLLLFVAMEAMIGWPEGRGTLTIILAHTSFGIAYVAIIVQARLAGFDRSLEEAALDLGARPAKVFFVITLPLIAPALAAGWLLAFTLSLDDLVIASFVTGPSATTLPMKIFSSARLGVSPQINALATIIVVTVAVIVAAAGRLMLGRKRSEAEM